MRSWLAVAMVLGTATSAWARSEKTLAYPREAVWPAAVRFLVVDEKSKIVDKDAEAGYVTFELRHEGKVYRGALEVMAVTVDGRPQVRFVLQVEDRPSWLELAMLKRLEYKLRAELGSPTPAPSRPAPGPGSGPHAPGPGKDAPPTKDAPPARDDAPTPVPPGVPISPTP